MFVRFLLRFRSYLLSEIQNSMQSCVVYGPATSKPKLRKLQHNAVKEIPIHPNASKRHPTTRREKREGSYVLACFA